MNAKGRKACGERGVGECPCEMGGSEVAVEDVDLTTGKVDCEEKGSGLVFVQRNVGVGCMRGGLLMTVTACGVLAFQAAMLPSRFPKRKIADEEFGILKRFPSLSEAAPAGLS